jgi:hypothetical protein
VVEGLFPVVDRHGPFLRRLADCHEDQLQGRFLVSTDFVVAAYPLIKLLIGSIKLSLHVLDRLL